MLKSAWKVSRSHQADKFIAMSKSPLVRVLPYWSPPMTTLNYKNQTAEANGFDLHICISDFLWTCYRLDLLAFRY